MTGLQLAAFLVGPIGGLLIAGLLFYVTRGDRRPPHPHPGE